jgi:hypothetical protein
VVTLEVENHSPRLAAALANALAAELVDLTSRTDAEMTDAVRDFTSKAAVTQLTAAQQAAVRAAAVSVFGAGISGRLHVIDPAVVPDEPVAPKVALLTALGGLAGFALVSVIVLVTSTGTEARSGGRDALAALNGVRYLGAVDCRSGGWPAGDGDARIAESYRLLATKLGLFGGRRPPGSLLVIDADDHQAGGPVAANLAAVVADAGSRVLLVDASSGGASRLLGLEQRPGYAELVRTDATRVEAMLDELTIR